MEILNSFNSIYEKLLLAVEKQIFPQIDQLMKAYYNILNNDSNISKNITKINDVFNMLCFSLVIFILTYYIAQNITSLYNGENRENIFKLFIKLICVYIIASNSMFIFKTFINIFDIISQYISIEGEKIIGCALEFKSLSSKISLLDTSAKDLFSLDGLIMSIVCYGAVNLLVACSVRYVCMLLCMIISPIVMMSVSIKQWRFIGIKYVKLIFILFISPIIMQTLLILPLMFKDNNDALYKIVLLGTLQILYKIENYIKEIF
ncbi:MAG: hypothetical protein RR922_04750 [Clostridia bacterium]